jgi:hypothetical protein
MKPTAAARSGALLRQLDLANRQHTNATLETRVACTEPGCRSELICQPQHVDNLTATWRCLEHRTDDQTQTPR